MKYFSFAASILFILALQIGLTSCNSPSSTTTLPGAWDKVGDFEGIPRGNAVGFMIGNFAYVGTGFNYEGNKRLRDFWKYDPEGDSWFQVADFPGTPRSSAVAFSLNGKGYVGTGLNLAGQPLRDFWVFDPTVGAKGQWTQIADFSYTGLSYGSDSARYGCIAFTVGSRSFVGGGHSLSSLKDLWEYLPAPANVWVQRPSIGGSKRENAFVMVIDDKAYVGGGIDNGRYVTDFYKFDIANLAADGTGSPWSRLNGLTGKDANGNGVVQPKPRDLASTFTINGIGYLACGSIGPGETWQYTPSNDTWVAQYSFTTNAPVSGSGRNGAIGFGLSVSGKSYGYVVTGSAGNLKFDDCWQFNPAGIEPDNK